MLAVLLLCAVALVLLGGLSYQHVVINKLHRCDWNELLTHLQAVPRAPVSEVATDYLNPQPNQLILEPMDVWAAVGGIEGVRRMRHNADVLIALAAYAERWNFEEGVIEIARRPKVGGLRWALLSVCVLSGGQQRRRGGTHVRIPFLRLFPF